MSIRLLAVRERLRHAVARIQSARAPHKETIIAKNSLLTAPSYPVEQVSGRLGANPRTARLRRNPRVREVADWIGRGPRAVADAENGKSSRDIAVYTTVIASVQRAAGSGDASEPD